MKVKELIEELSKLDGERLVVMSKDGEGNSYSPLADVIEATYVPETTWRGDLGDDSEPNGIASVVLYPTN